MFVDIHISLCDLLFNNFIFDGLNVHNYCVDDINSYLFLIILVF